MSCEGVAPIYVAANQVLLEIEEDPNVHDRAQAIGTAKTNLANAKSRLRCMRRKRAQEYLQFCWSRWRLEL